MNLGLAKAIQLGRQIWGYALILLAMTVVLTWLFFRMESVSPIEHLNYSRILGELHSANEEVNAEALASRVELSRNYDKLTASMANLQKLGLAAKELPGFVLNADASQMDEEALKLQVLMTMQVQLVENFKRKNAVLRNSQSYFTTESNKILGENLPENIRRPFEHYVRHIHEFSRDPNDNYLHKIAETRRQLANSQIPNNYALDLESLLLHGDTIERYLPEVNDSVRQIRELGIAPKISELGLHYKLAYDDAMRAADNFRRAMYVLALLLVGFLSYVFIRLESSRRLLAGAHKELRFLYDAQVRTEKRLLLHKTAFENSHDGIVMTDAAGNVMEINPAFTRITGYERAEVVGRNPSMIKSGRHDQDFYAAMWKSINSKGCWQGEIWNRSKYGEIYPELLSISAVRNQLGETTNYVAVFSDIRELKEQETKLAALAYHDALTGLPNRVLLSDRLHQAMSKVARTNTLLAVCYLDLDGFKPVNDTYGHEAGDSLLKEIAQRLEDIIRGGYTAARLCRDEFVLLFALDKLEECEKAMHRLLDAIQQPIQLEEAEVQVTGSVGVTIYPTYSSAPDALLRHADQAMYIAKQTGKNQFRFFDCESDFQIRTKHDSVSHIEKALHNKEFVLHYQPKVDMRRGAVIGAEALIRWRHPERGLLAPGEFMPLIEAHDMNIQIGRWVIESALQQLESWLDQGMDFKVSVNVTSQQLLSPGFVEELHALLERHPVGRNRLELEILESSALEDLSRVSHVIEQCRKFDVSCSLDDFGTGYSSLTYLKRLPVSTIKLDQSFVSGLASDANNLAIIQGVLGLASAFQRQVIAEGVETIEEGRVLLQFECDYAQGYAISKPLPVEQFSGWAANWQPDPSWQRISRLHWGSQNHLMFVAKIELNGWVSHLIRAAKSDLPLPKGLLVEQTQCDFCDWYYGQGASLYRSFASFLAIEAPHKRVHEIAKKIHIAWRNMQHDDVDAMLEELESQRAMVLKAIEQLEFDVAIDRKI